MSSDPASPGLSLGVLGGVWAEIDGDRLALGGPRQRAVLAALLAARGSVLTLDQLVDAVWEDDPPAAAVGTVQTYISNLRRVLEPGRAARETSRVLVSAAPGYVLRVDPDAVDAWRFERVVPSSAAGHDPASRRESLERALSWWGGEPFAGMPSSAWVDAEGARLRELRWLALEQLSAALLATGAYVEAEERARLVTVEAPLREEGWRLLALAQYASGRAGDGLATLRCARDILDHELGIDPGPALRELEHRMLNRDVVLPTGRGVDNATGAEPARPQPAEPTEPGAASRPIAPIEPGAPSRPTESGAPVEPAELHSVPSGSFANADPAATRPPARDLAAAVREADEPVANRPLPARPAAVVGAPVQLRPLLGRDAEVVALAEAVAAGRLVTITGAGGSGKTRLAVAVAERLADQVPDGAHFVTLQDVADLPAVWSLLAQHFELEPAGEVRAHLVRVLGERQLVLVLDNLEHLDGVDAVVAALLAAPNLRILATSRRPLLLSGEQEFPLPALSLPADDAPATVQASGAGAFFCECARGARPGFELSAATSAAVAGLCRRLDGLPLALELAAAQLRFFTPAALLAHLDEHLSVDLGRGLTAGDRPERHRTLGATIAYSHDLLDDDDQVVFRRLGVFAGRVPMAAITAVLAAGDAEPRDLFGSVTRLTLAGLVRVEPDEQEPRFGMLDTIRDFARQQLRSAGEEDRLRRQHLMWCSDTAVDAWHHINFDGVSDAGPAALLHEVRAAIRYAIGDAPPDAADIDVVRAGVDLLNAVALEWAYVGGSQEVLLWIDRAATLLRAGEPGRRTELARQRVLQLLAVGDDPLPLKVELTRLLAQVPQGDALLIARLHFALGHAASRLSDWESGADEFLTAADFAERVGASALALDAYSNACNMFLSAGLHRRALDIAAPALAGMQNGSRPGAGEGVLRVMACVACLALGDLPQAGEYLSGASAGFLLTSQLDRVNLVQNIPEAAFGLAAALSRPADAVQLWTWARLEAGDLGIRNRFDGGLWERLPEIRGRLSAEQWDDALARGARLSLAEVFALVDDIARAAASLDSPADATGHAAQVG